VVDDDIGNLGGGIQSHAERGKRFCMKVDKVSPRVADTEDGGTGRPTGAEHFDDGFNQ
jgi:hypothetical protein